MINGRFVIVLLILISFSGCGAKSGPARTVPTVNRLSSFPEFWNKPTVEISAFSATVIDRCKDDYLTEYGSGSGTGGFLHIEKILQDALPNLQYVVLNDSSKADFTIVYVYDTEKDVLVEKFLVPGA